jgi:hypothetical protein
VADDDLRQFMHELLMRFERRTLAMERRLDTQTEALRENTREMHESLRDMRDQIRAQTQAILHVLDELRGPGPAST